MTIEEEAIWLAKAVLLLDKNGFIFTYDEHDEPYCEHLRIIAIGHARTIQKLDAAKRIKPND